MAGGVRTVALEEWRVTFVMQAGRSRRTFVLTIPAEGEAGAKTGAWQLALAINEASGHVWKATDEVAVEAAV